jgi:hypothetical protein
MNSLGRSARGALILLLALVIGVWVISKTVSSPAAPNASGGNGASGGTETTVALSSTTTTTAAPARDPKTVRVLMVNGTTTAGIAKLAGKCIKDTYDVLAPKNATTKPLATSVLYAGPNAEREAKAIASSLGYPGQVVQFPLDPGVRDYPTPAPDVMLIIGDDMGATVRNLTCAQNPS